VVVTRASLAAACLFLAGCASVQAPPHGSVPVIAGEGPSLDDLTRGAPLTVVVFFSSHCPCQRAHDERLRALASKYGPAGVRFVAVDAEAGASRPRDEAEARARGYSFPILDDPSGSLADSLGAEYATYTVVLDAGQRVRYEGGIDSNKQHLTEDASFFLRDALDDLLAGREPRVPEGKTLGCVLRRK
jgi:thiol-disulfide isomerase/thioredoxin